MSSIPVDVTLVSYCGLYCGACKKKITGKCPGCAENEKASWCNVRTCCIENNFKSCADCGDYPDKRDCRKLNNVVSKIFGFIFRSDRLASLKMIGENGYEAYAKEMVEQNKHCIKR